MRISELKASRNEKIENNLHTLSRPLLKTFRWEFVQIKSEPKT